jgi:hypothetical protein
MAPITSQIGLQAEEALDTAANQPSAGAHPPRLLSKLNDGKQVEPAPAEPENVQVREARRSNGELARE